MRILIVEDNEITANILESNLHQRRYETVIAHTGTEALTALETHWDISLVIADIQIPEIDGLELVRRMREETAWRDIPVVICSSMADAEHVSLAARLGCKHYLLKPIDRVQLLLMVDKLIASEKPHPVLGDRTQIQSQYSLTSQALDAILHSFANLVDESITAMESSQSTQDSSPLNLAKLAEGAVTLGAERLNVPLRAMQLKNPSTQPTSEERNSLLMELRLIKRALASQLQMEKQPAISKAEAPNAAAPTA
jgi:CheY-like chemotaxis protein